MKILDHKDAINRRLYNNQSFVETAIHRVSCLNRSVLGSVFINGSYRRRSQLHYSIS
ncbi:MAG: hypothetical protein KME52_27520 [Desmonostoc geniculatum HA4340-LM1]|nr:hypothetical protein [Desmonostoc geniculatum HA4340-LM1]